MQTIELTAVITQDHEIYLKLPADVKATYAKVIVMYEDRLKDNTLCANRGYCIIKKPANIDAVLKPKSQGDFRRIIYPFRIEFHFHFTC